MEFFSAIKLHTCTFPLTVLCGFPEKGATCDSISDRAKQEYKRTRPFVYYNQQTLVPEQEESHINNGSYPSGHTVLDMDNVLVDFKSGLDRVPEDIKAKYADDGTGKFHTVKIKT